MIGVTSFAAKLSASNGAMAISQPLLRSSM